MICGTEAPAQRAEPVGRVFLLTLLPRSKRVRRRAGPQPRGFGFALPNRDVPVRGLSQVFAARTGAVP